MTNRNLELGRVGLYSLEPEKQENVLREVNDEFTQRYRDDLKELLKRGALIFDKEAPEVRLQAMMGQTLEEDIPYLLAEDYWELRMANLAPPLAVEQIAAEYAQAMQAQAELQMQAQEQGVEAPQVEIPPAPTFWPDMIALDPVEGTAFKHFASEFRRLSKAAS